MHRRLALAILVVLAGCGTFRPPGVVPSPNTTLAEPTAPGGSPTERTPTPAEPVPTTQRFIPTAVEPGRVNDPRSVLLRNAAYESATVTVTITRLADGTVVVNETVELPPSETTTIFETREIGYYRIHAVAEGGGEDTSRWRVCVGYWDATISVARDPYETTQPAVEIGHAHVDPTAKHCQLTPRASPTGTP